MLKFECHYCPAIYPDLKGLIDHFEDKHRDSGEYVEIKVEDLFDAKGES